MERTLGEDLSIRVLLRHCEPLLRIFLSPLSDEKILDHLLEEKAALRKDQEPVCKHESLGYIVKKIEQIMVSRGMEFVPERHNT